MEYFDEIFLVANNEKQHLAGFEEVLTLLKEIRLLYVEKMCFIKKTN